MKVIIFDVDGVLTDGKFTYTVDGKISKRFGPDDSDALSLIENYIDIQFISGDHRGFEISKARIVTDMGRSLELVSTTKRIEWIADRWCPEEVIYMGDGIFDSLVFDKVGYSIAPNNADNNLKKKADYVTERAGGDRAVAEACLHILEIFFEPYVQN